MLFPIVFKSRFLFVHTSFDFKMQAIEVTDVRELNLRVIFEFCSGFWGLGAKVLQSLEFEVSVMKLLKLFWWQLIWESLAKYASAFTTHVKQGQLLFV